MNERLPRVWVEPDLSRWFTWRVRVGAGVVAECWTRRGAERVAREWRERLDAGQQA